MGRSVSRVASDSALVRLTLALIVAAAMLLVAGSVRGDEIPPEQNLMSETGSLFGSPGGAEHCWTQIKYNQKFATKDAQACTPQGPCDLPATRDSWIPDENVPITYIKLFFHILRNDDGSNAATTPEMVGLQVAHLNEDYLPFQIQFEYDWDFVNSSAYRYLDDNEMNPMKAAHAIAPDSQLNVFVSYVNESYSYGTFPWDNDAQTVFGGIVMTTGHFSSVQSVLAHEIGHCLGLWHTHHGVSEVSTCGSCYERAGAADRDYTGDLCSDTDPTPVNYSCSGPGGVDGCSGNNWGQTDTQNFMGYGPDFCITEFSPQQAGRMHCWINDQLTSWVEGVRFVATNTFGPVPLDVSFEGITSKNVNEWNWEFGDGSTADIASPDHTYTLPGNYTVDVSINAADGVFAAQQKNLVFAYADTMLATDATGQVGQQVRVDINAVNYIPLTRIEIPFSWAGDFNMTFDSLSTAGLRTDFVSQKTFINYGAAARRAAYHFDMAAAAQTLEPGSGPILSLYFRIPPGASGTSNPVTIAPYSSYTIKFECTEGTYEPVFYSGVVSLDACLAGDVNADGQGPDLSDLIFLVNYLFSGGPSPVDSRQANANGSGDIDLSDLIYLVNYLFNGGPDPICPAS